MNLLLMRRLMMTPSDTYSTITGNAPLTLSNAKSKKIKSLIQYGGCSQSSTPTPSSPVDIYCNNGKIVARRQSGLPIGYKLIDSMSMNNNCVYRITDFKLQGSDTIKFSYMVTANCNVLGSYSGSPTGDNYSLYVSTSSGDYMRYGSDAYSSTVDANTKYDVEITPYGTHGLKVDATWTPLEFTTTVDFFIGSTSTSVSSATFKGTFYGNIEVVGRAKFLQCERITDSVVGWYDLYSDTFYAPESGSTNPTKGNYVTDPVVGFVEGTDEVITIQGKNLNSGTLDHVGYSSTGQTSESSTFAGTMCKIPTTGGEKFTVSCGNIPNGISGVFINTWLTDGTWNMRQAIAAVDGVLTYTVGAGIGLINFTLYKTGGVELTNSSWMQVEYGSTATTYTPYVTPQTASVVNLFAVGEYEDTQDILTGAITRNIGVKVFDGTEQYSSMSYGYATDELSDFPDENFAPLCTHFVGKSTSTSAVDTLRIYFTSGGVPRTYFYVDQTVDDFSTGDKFKAWLATQYKAGTPVIVVYPLATETTEQVSPQSLSTNSGTNTVTITANVSPVSLEVTYAKR